MAVWSVFEPPSAAPGSFEAADRSAFVREGWCWAAFLIPPVWLLWRRMWLVFLAWLAAAVIFAVATSRLPVPSGLADGLGLLFAVWFALEANGLRRWTLQRRGWRLAGLATGRGRTEAEHQYFSARDIAAPAVARAAAPRASLPAGWRAPPTVLGVFPDPAGPAP